MIHKPLDFYKAANGALLAGDVSHCKASQAMQTALWGIYIRQLWKPMDDKCHWPIVKTEIEYERAK